jgi:hypothetical protein
MAPMSVDALVSWKVDLSGILLVSWLDEKSVVVTE